MLTVDKLKKSFFDASELKDALLSSQLVTRDLFVHFKNVAHIIEVVSSYDELQLVPHFLEVERPLSQEAAKRWTFEGASIIVLKDGSEHLVAGYAGDVASYINLVRRGPKEDQSIYAEERLSYHPLIRFDKIEIVPEGP